MTTEEELIQLGQQWDEAMVTNQVDEIGKFMCADWVIIGADGLTTKESFLALIASGVLTHHRMESEEVIVKIYENTGILTSRGYSCGTFNRQPFDLYEWSSNVFIKEHEKWRCVSTMLCPASKV